MPDLRREVTSEEPEDVQGREAISKMFWFVGRTFCVSPAVPLAKDLFFRFVEKKEVPELDVYIYACVMVASKFVFETEWLGVADYSGVPASSVKKISLAETDILRTLGWQIQI